MLSSDKQMRTKCYIRELIQHIFQTINATKALELPLVWFNWHFKWFLLSYAFQGSGETKSVTSSKQNLWNELNVKLLLMNYKIHALSKLTCIWNHFNSEECRYCINWHWTSLTNCSTVFPMTLVLTLGVLIQLEYANKSRWYGTKSLTVMSRSLTLARFPV